MSRNPRVTSMPTRAVLPSMMALVATVVAWTTAAASRPPAPHSSRPRSSAVMKPRAGSSGVVRTLTTRARPSWSRAPGEGLRLAPLRLLDHAGAGEDDLRPLVHRHVDHAAVEVDRGGAATHALLEGLDHAARVLDFGGIGREDPVQHSDLVGMDAARALAAELPRPLGRLLEGDQVAKARDATHQPGRLHADDLADGDEVRDGVHELDAVRGGLHAQLEAIVLDADAHGGDAVARAGDLLDGEKAARSFEGEGQAQVA